MTNRVTNEVTNGVTDGVTNKVTKIRSQIHHPSLKSAGFSFCHLPTRRILTTAKIGLTPRFSPPVRGLPGGLCGKPPWEPVRGTSLGACAGACAGDLPGNRLGMKFFTQRHLASPWRDPGFPKPRHDKAYTAMASDGNGAETHRV